MTTQKVINQTIQVNILMQALLEVIDIYPQLHREKKMRINNFKNFIEQEQVKFTKEFRQIECSQLNETVEKIVNFTKDINVIINE